VPWDVREVVSDAFHIACRNGHTDVARWLLTRGADVDAPGFFGGTALHWAAGNGHLDTVRFLLAHGAITDLEDDELHATPRGWAEHFEHRDIAALID
jgi:ankyrin repeat protein